MVLRIREGDNLYTNSLLALDPGTGTLKWHYQFTPHDVHDWDSNHVPVLADVGDRKVVMVANRNGFFYVLDRRTGEVIVGKPFTGTTWAREIGKDGRPIVLNDGVMVACLTCGAGPTSIRRRTTRRSACSSSARASRARHTSRRNP